ncbi:MAG: UDP-3-O-acyl-N-acetylglucosamine deacetylase [Deltaproteobacteria bacterium]|nr:UDP-3-O-acyl-N-acetylglucosamine deacetylase [Deltaproteobacteria bacterium]
MAKQKTLKNSVSFNGIGLHSGKKVNVRILPADENSGITFIRTDVSGGVVIKACSKNVVDTRLATTLGLEGITLGTVEHLLAAFYGLEIDNAVVEVDSCEIPIMDGSALPFVELIQTAGIETQKKIKKIIVIKRPIKVRDGRKVALMLPARDFKITYSISFDHPFLKNQSLSTVYSETSFKDELCGARTFGFLKEVEWLRSQGLVAGGSLENAIVIDDTKIINRDCMRFPDEFVRHKILDCMGDISLLGATIRGHIIAERSGHCLNQKLVRKVIESPSSWTFAEEIPAATSYKDTIREMVLDPAFSYCYVAS